VNVLKAEVEVTSYRAFQFAGVPSHGLISRDMKGLNTRILSTFFGKVLS